MKRNGMGIVISALSMALIGSIGIGVGISILQTECAGANQRSLVVSSNSAIHDESLEYEWHLEKTHKGDVRLVVSALP